MLQEEIRELQKCASFAHSIALEVAAGHGLNYQNVEALASIEEVAELNIGQSIVARSVFVGLENAVREMKNLVKR